MIPAEIADRAVLLDRPTYERVLTAALSTGRILSHYEPLAKAGLQNLMMWPTIDGDQPIVLIAGES